MGIAYQVWDTQTGNLIGSFPTEEDALTTIQREVVESGSAYIGNAWALWATDSSGKALCGDELLNRAKMYPLSA